MRLDATVDAPDFARFEGSKSYLPSSSNAPVNVTMSCDAGVPLVQDQDVVPGNPVTFVLTSIPSTGADCTIAETTSGSGDFTVSYNDGTVSSTNCSYNNVVAENEQEREIYRCAITNTAKPATFRVKKVWNIHPQTAGGDVSDLDSFISLRCSNPGTISGGTYWGNWSGYYWYYNSNAEDGDEMSLKVDIATYGTTTCYGSENDGRSDVEVSYSGCSGVSLGPNDDKTCTITNTLFFEGIPTLSQYGMAIMALLMLGLGFVGFRRFV